MGIQLECMYLFPSIFDFPVQSLLPILVRYRTGDVQWMGFRLRKEEYSENIDKDVLNS